MNLAFSGRRKGSRCDASRPSSSRSRRPNVSGMWQPSVKKRDHDRPLSSSTTCGLSGSTSLAPSPQLVGVDLAPGHPHGDRPQPARLAEQAHRLERHRVVQLGERPDDRDLRRDGGATVVDERHGVERIGRLDRRPVEVRVDDRVAPGLADAGPRVAPLVLAEVVPGLLTVARQEARAVVQDVLVVLHDEDGGYGGLPPGQDRQHPRRATVPPLAGARPDLLQIETHA